MRNVKPGILAAVIAALVALFSPSAMAQGCCKVGSGCASPVSADQCSSLRGTFHDGAVCIVEDGSCRVPHTGADTPAQTPIPADNAAAGEQAAADDATPAGEEEPYRGTHVVNFAAVDGFTVLNRDFVGTVHTVSLIAIDGQRRPPSREEITVTQRGQNLDVRVKEGLPIRGFSVQGDRGEVVAEKYDESTQVVTVTATAPKRGDDDGTGIDEPDPVMAEDDTGNILDVSGNSHLEKEVRRTWHPDARVRRIQELSVIDLRLKNTVMLLGERATAADRAGLEGVTTELNRRINELRDADEQLAAFVKDWRQSLTWQWYADTKRVLHDQSESGAGTMAGKFPTPGEDASKPGTGIGDSFNQPDTIADADEQSPEDSEDPPAQAATAENGSTVPAAFVSRLWIDRQVTRTLDSDSRVRTLQLAYFEAKRRLMTDKVLGTYDEDAARAFAAQFDKKIEALRAQDPALADFVLLWKGSLDYLMHVGFALAQYGRPDMRMEKEALVKNLPKRIDKTALLQEQPAPATPPATESETGGKTVIAKEDRLDALLRDFVTEPQRDPRGLSDNGLFLDDKGALDAVLDKALAAYEKANAAGQDQQGRTLIAPEDRIDSLLDDFVGPVGTGGPDAQGRALNPGEFMFLGGPIIPDLPNPLSSPQIGPDWGAYSVDPPYWLEQGGLPVNPLNTYPSLPGHIPGPSAAVPGQPPSPGSAGPLPDYVSPRVMQNDFSDIWQQQGTNFWPHDGMVDLRARNLNESFAVPEGFNDVVAGPGAHELTVNDKPAEIIAMRGNELAAIGEDIPLGTPDSSVSLIRPDGYGIAADMPSWGFEADTQPYVELGAWYPINVQLVGVGANELIPITFYPNAGQFIQPLTVAIIGSQAETPTPVANFMTTVEGVQKFTAKAFRDHVPAVPPPADDPYKVQLPEIPLDDLFGETPIFADGFESGDTSAWSNQERPPAPRRDSPPPDTPSDPATQSDTQIFEDGFESGDTSSWGNTVP